MTIGTGGRRAVALRWVHAVVEDGGLGRGGDAQDGDIELLARDDGAGAGELALGNGLRGLRERFEQLGGEITIDPGPGFMVRGRLAGS